MKRFLKLLVCFAALCTLIVLPVTASAANEPYGIDGFYIKSYDVNAVISENNVYDVTETIHVYFTEDKHGIIREIPINSKEIRENADGSTFTSRVRSSVWDVNVQGYNYEVNTEDDTTSIKIGNADYTVNGDQTYKIHYKIGFGNDGSEDWDEAYYNIIGTRWPCSIDNITFSVTLPKEFDKSKLGFSTGAYASSGYNPDKLYFDVKENTITGSYKGMMDEYEGLTMRLELPQGYFKVPDLRLPDWIMMGVMAALVFFSLILFLLYGRDKKPVETVEFYAPDGLTPSEVGYIIDGSVDDRDVVSLIIYWADKGYLSITDNKSSNYTLTKLREMDKDAKGFERHMFEGLFRKGDIVHTSSLQYTFYHTYNSTKSMIQASFEPDDRRVFTRKSLGLMPLLSFFTAIPFMLGLVLTLERVDGELIFGLVVGIIAGVALLIPSYIIIGLLRKWRGTSKRAGKLTAALIFWALFNAGALAIVAGGAYEPLLPLVMLISTIIIGLCAVFISKRTDQGTEWLGKILGLKNFIEVAELDRILLLVQENPSYFYRILPYAYVLGVTDKWIKNFETITIAPPTWYYGTGPFTPYLFMGSMNNAMSTMRSQMVSTPPSSSSGGGGGGGFSGGGFSGGGGGGGGGSSW